MKSHAFMYDTIEMIAGVNENPSAEATGNKLRNAMKSPMMSTI